MEYLSYIFRAGHRAISSSLLLLALFFCSDGLAHSGKGNSMGTYQDAALFYIIEAKDGKGGDITPEGKVFVWAHSSMTFEMDPDRGKEVKDVEVDGVSVGAVNSYTFYNVTSNHTISVSFQTERFSITASAGPGGSITPSGIVEVKEGDKESFEIRADEGYEILDVIVDGESQGAISKFEFSKVKADHTIHATFSRNLFVISASSGEGGSISPSGEIEVRKEDSQRFDIRANEAYDILDVVVDGESQGALTSYEFTRVTTDHSIEALFSRAAEVLDVSIPDVSMAIGDRIPATLTVGDDDGVPYSLVSGSVGGYELGDFQRLSSTAYRAYFTIQEGGPSYLASQDIPVSNLVIAKGSVLSLAYNRPISQGSDPLDASLPVISSMEVEGGTLKVGDEVHLGIQADGINYRLHQLSTINGIAVTDPAIDFSETGSGNYLLSCVIQEGDRDAGGGSAALSASIILVKPSGNTGLPYTEVNNASQLIIDAHAPVLTRMEVPSIEVGVGGTVKVELRADGAAYTGDLGSHVNGVPLSSSRLTLQELSPGQYELSYLVSIEDADVAPGSLQASIVLIDAAGNHSEPFGVFQANSLEIYTALPDAAFGGTPQICEGDEAEMNILLSGRSPWSFDLDDGSTLTSFTNITSPNYQVTVAPEQTTTYQISSLRDVNGVENTSAANTLVTVNERPEVEIINLATGYNVEADPVKLEANVPGGIFTGPGVISATGTFYPGVADTLDSPHTITYTYENDNGCISTTQKLVYVLGSRGEVLIPDKVVCQNDEPFLVSVMNVPGENGSFKLLDTNSQTVPGLTDHGDKTATIDPSSLVSENYTIEYQYLDQVTLYVRKAFSVESAMQPQILNLAEESYCQSLAPFELKSDLEEVIFEGPGVSGSRAVGYTFHPRETDPGVFTISCTSVSENGCTASSHKEVTTLFSPEVLFEVSTECMPEEGEMVSFYNRTNGKSSIESWSWDFGDAGSGENNFSTLSDPTHRYQEPGEKRISLTATTEEGCVSSYVLETPIDSKPVADFTWISDCFTSGSELTFINRSTHGSASVDTVIWTFKTSLGEVLGEVGTLSDADTVTFPFLKADTYQVHLYTQNKGGCFSELSKELVLSPTILLDSEGYKQSFDDTDGSWRIRSEDQVESWTWGIPDFTGHIGLEGDHAWFTHFPPELSGYRENSWIQSPCFDFSEMKRPLIRMDILRSFAPIISGAVLQYRDEHGEEWKTVGANTPGIEWYNASQLVNKPGGSSIGWGMNEFNPDRDWVTAIHDLDQVAGKSNVVFRIAIGTNGKSALNNQGFAFNNIEVAERTKLAVVEHFTSNTSDTSRLADDLIDAFGRAHRMDLIDLQYHMDVGGVDPMNRNNPLASSTRSFNYGIPEIPFSVLDGGADSHHRYDFSQLSTLPVEDHLRLITLEEPAFDIDLLLNWMESGLEASTTVTCLSDHFEHNLQLYLVVFETSVTAYTGRNGDTQFRNVVLDMLPSPAGRLLGDNWRKGGVDERTQSWTYKSYVEDINELALAAFIQDRTTGKILQAVVDYKDETVGNQPLYPEIKKLSVYPNPAHTHTYVNLGETSRNSGRIELLDLNGKVVLQTNVPAGYQIYQLDLDDLNKGLYILRWIESDQTRGLSKVVKAQ